MTDREELVARIEELETALRKIQRAEVHPFDVYLVQLARDALAPKP